MSDTTMKTIEERLLVWLNRYASEHNLPSVFLDYAATGDSISFQTIGVQKTLKEYINGSSLKRISFRLARNFRGADTSSVSSIDAINGLESFASYVRGKKGEGMDEHTVIIKADASTPSLLWRSEEGESAYGITFSIDYKEE